MKKLIFSAIIMAIVTTGCKKSETEVSNTESSETVVTEATDTVATATSEPVAEVFSCEMHPEVKGSKGEKCSKCGMDLTVPVSQ